MQPRTHAALLEYVDTIDPIAYQRTRNHHDGAVTKLSPYITRGVITLPEIRDQLLSRHSPKSAYKLVQELAWRDYFQLVWWERGDAIFSDLRFARPDAYGEEWAHHQLVSTVIAGNTGIQAIDAAVQDLYQTGYMHNHFRMFVASLACNLARAHRLPMGQWLYYHLRDGDPASNFLSWQWVAGASISKRYTISQSLINKFSSAEEHQAHTYLSFDRDDMCHIAIPAELTGSEPMTLTTPYDRVSIDQLPALVGRPVELYTPWTLRPLKDGAESDAIRVLLIDPKWFERLPVSASVLSFIVEQARVALSDVVVHVGSVADLDLASAASIAAWRHQTNQGDYDWSHQSDATVNWHDWPRLFPAVSRYHKSFFSYWKAVEKGLN
jgi:deoxyribodipyrimidine photo-lyase